MNDLPPRRNKRSSVVRNILMLLRRSHLYFGLLLMPWAMLYGITGYLFNHPTHFPETSIRAIDNRVTYDTKLAKLPSPNSVAEQVISELNQRFHHEPPLALNLKKPVRYEGDFFIATSERVEDTLQLLLYRDGSGGTMRTQKKEAPKPESDTPYFAVTPSNPKQETKGATTAEQTTDELSLSNITPLKLEIGIDHYCKESLPTIVQRLNIVGSQSDANGFKITTAPETTFHVIDQDREWAVRYNSITGAVSAKPATASSAQPQSWRRFLLRMHTAHGYPIETNARWFWAIIVDVMAFVMVFWGMSGIIMWWQIKRTRPWGTVALIVSIILATSIAIGMSML